MSAGTIDLYYEEKGAGKPLVLVHGYPLDHSIWNEVARRLEGQAWVILPDLRGFGQSPVVAGVATMEAQANDLARLLDRLGIERAVLAGHSMGGYISLAFARAYPERLAGLVMIASQAAADSPERRQARYETADRVLDEGTVVVADSMAQGLSNRSDLVAPLRKLILTAAPEGVAAALKGMAERRDQTDILAQIRVPALVIAGLADPFIPVEKARLMAASLPQARLVELPDVGHSPMLEAPEEVAQALKNLL